MYKELGDIFRKLDPERLEQCAQFIRRSDKITVQEIRTGGGDELLFIYADPLTGRLVGFLLKETESGKLVEPGTDWKIDWKTVVQVEKVKAEQVTVYSFEKEY